MKKRRTWKKRKRSLGSRIRLDGTFIFGRPQPREGSLSIIRVARTIRGVTSSFFTKSTQTGREL